MFSFSYSRFLVDTNSYFLLQSNFAYFFTVNAKKIVKKTKNLSNLVMKKKEQ